MWQVRVMIRGAWHTAYYPDREQAQIVYGYYRDQSQRVRLIAPKNG